MNGKFITASTMERDQMDWGVMVGPAARHDRRLSIWLSSK